jgi:thiol-disulfide isomerase/thioredoxin
MWNILLTAEMVGDFTLSRSGYNGRQRCPVVMCLSCVILPLTLLAAGHSALGQSASLTKGAPAPDIILQRLLPEQPVANATLQALAGRAVVLEFWTTWCSGCVEQIQHLNQLAAHFAGRPVQFISVTNQKAEVVKPFLKQHPISGWVGISCSEKGTPFHSDEDRDGDCAPDNVAADLFRQYDVRLLPKTVLIDSSGKVAATTWPLSVHEYMLEDLIAGRPVASLMFREGLSTILSNHPIR